MKTWGQSAGATSSDESVFPFALRMLAARRGADSAPSAAATGLKSITGSGVPTSAVRDCVGPAKTSDVLSSSRMSSHLNLAGSGPVSTTKPMCSGLQLSGPGTGDQWTTGDSCPTRFRTTVNRKTSPRFPFTPAIVDSGIAIRATYPSPDFSHFTDHSGSQWLSNLA